MKTFAYSFNTDANADAISRRFQAIADLPIDARNRKVNKEWYRVESIESKRGYWLLDFVKIRMDHGPGRGGLRSEVEGFDLENDEGFCEETAVLFVPQSKVMGVQYNHYGPRISAITEYLALFDLHDPWSASVDPYLDKTIEEKLNKKTIFTKFQMSFRKEAFSKAEYDANRSVKHAVQCAAMMGGNKITIEVSATGEDNTLAGNIKDLAKLVLRKMSGEEEVEIDSAKLSAKESIDDKLELLDLVAQRVNVEEDIATGQDKRYPRLDRWSAVERAYSRWLADKALK